MSVSFTDSDLKLDADFKFKNGRISSRIVLMADSINPAKIEWLHENDIQ